MNPTELKKKLARLWMDTFHDSEKYVSLIFDNYFDPEFAEFEEVDGKFAAGLVGIPYEFGNAEQHLRGLYLCGLATVPEFRSRGIMTQMLSRINEKAKNAGFAFTFLIPADDGLRKYYHDRDYVNAFYRVVDNYTSLHDFDRDYESELALQKDKVAQLKRRYFQSLKTGKIDAAAGADEAVTDAIRELIRELESSQPDLQIIHSDRDVDIILKENALDGGAVFYTANNSGKITAVAFTHVTDFEVDIVKLYAADLASRYKVLGAVKRAFPDYGIRHFVSSIEMDRKALWVRTYGSVMPEAPQAGAVSATERVYSLAAHAKVYGMARILNLSEILKFQAELRHDLKYSILMKADDNYTFEQIDVRDGKLKIKNLSADVLSPSQTAYTMSHRDISEILFRRRDTDNMITEAFGIPSINGAICLMLD